MKYTEFQIREKIAANLNLFDSHLKLIKQEYSLRLDDGRQAFIDILARDIFGCYTIIEIKKSNKSARTTIQQLYKYAAFFKIRNRLEDHQIRLMVISTDWDEISAPFSEFKMFSPYESIGYKLKNIEELTFEQINPDFITGNCNPLKNFYLLRFNNKKARDTALSFIKTTIERIPSLNVYFFILNANSPDTDALRLYDLFENPFAIAMVSFTGNVQTALIEAEFLNIETNHIDEINLARIKSYETESTESTLRSLLVIYLLKNINIHSLKAYAPHTLNNLFNQSDLIEQFGLGPMFRDELFSEREIFDICNGYFGAHPYIFRCIATPKRTKHFKEFRLNVNDFLKNNKNWQMIVNDIINELDEEDIIEIQIFNTLNFYGLLNDFHYARDLSRKPHLRIHIDSKGKNRVLEGTIMWNGFILAVNPEPFITASYPTIDIFRIRSIMQYMTEFDTKLSDLHGITHELINTKENTIYDTTAKKFVQNNKYDFRKYLACHSRLIQGVGNLYKKYEIGINNNNSGIVTIEPT